MAAKALNQGQVAPVQNTARSIVITPQIEVAARGTGRAREIEDPKAGRAGHAAVIHTPIESQNRTEQSASLEAFARHRCPKDLN